MRATLIRLLPAATVALGAWPALAGSRRGRRVVPLLSTAATAGMSFAHALERPGKLACDGPLWWHLQRTLYRPWWGHAGHLEGVSLLSTAALTVTERRTGARTVPLAAIALALANPVVFLWKVAPANRATKAHTPEDLPHDWEALRAAWELGHVLRCAAHAVALTALVTEALDG